MAATMDSGQRQLLELASQRLVAESARRAAGQAGADAGAGAASSNYDYVKIKVRLGSNLEHYYILSRFLLSRMLTVINLPQHKAVRIALDVKKQLVDAGRLDITQEELEEVLFGLLQQRGYGPEYVRRYQMVTHFFQQKRPLIILVAGSACTGKSSLAQQLASRLNLPNVLQTDVLCELLRSSGMGNLPAEPLWQRPLPPGASLVEEFQRECGIIRRALDGDLCKCIRDGKSIIIEGLHIDPGLFLREFGDPRGNPEALLQTMTMIEEQQEQGEQQQKEEEGEAGLCAAGGLEGGLTAAESGRQSGEAETEVGAAEAAMPRAAPAAARGVLEAAADAEQQLADLQLTDETRAAAAGQVVVPKAPLPSKTAQPVPTPHGSSSVPGSPGGQQRRHEWQRQQPTSSAAGAAAAAAARLLALPSEATAALSAGVRRTASFGDAVSRLSYASLRRQQSPWKDASISRHRVRPGSARVGDGLEQRGQAVFMLQSTEGGSEGGETEATAAAAAVAPSLPPPVPSPRLVACISLPPVMEHGLEQLQLQLQGQEEQLELSGSSSHGVPAPATAEQPSACHGSSSSDGQLASSRPTAGDKGAVAGGAAGAGGGQAGMVSPLHLDDAMVSGAAHPLGSCSTNSSSQHASTEPGGGELLQAAAGAAATAAAPLEQQQQQPQLLQSSEAQGHSSVAAADAAAAAAAGTGPVFVPICLAVPGEEEYEALLHDWLAMQQRAGISSSTSSGTSSGGGGTGCNEVSWAGGHTGSDSGGGSGGGSVPAQVSVERLRALQGHLRRYAAAGVPVVELHPTDMGRALDSMHAYVLQCIALATGDSYE